MTVQPDFVTRTGVSATTDLGTYKQRLQGVAQRASETDAFINQARAQKRLEDQQKAYEQQQKSLQESLARSQGLLSASEKKADYYRRLGTMYSNAPPSGGGSKYLGSSSVAINQAQTGGNSVYGNASGLINTAKQWLGVPYSWGGGGTKGPSRGIAQGRNTIGFDCSGLVQNVYAKMGIKLPRLGSAQFRSGQRVSTPMPGDIVAYGSPIHHVAIYIGGGKIIEAPRTGLNVRISSVSGPGRPMFSRILK
jgi:cell wall-associated NlpC family hydrolase